MTNSSLFDLRMDNCTKRSSTTKKNATTRLMCNRCAKNRMLFSAKIRHEPK